ncbi:hypothetical protein PMN64_36945 [Bradyrhizobium sp. UFLA01-814]|uniref:hypothetical protein n=1 Tax=Bradyrhizobium sp. UFLA01-814 TaxID=3023480 RepID=UPI00398B57C1
MINVRMLGAQTEADHWLEQGVLADLKGQDAMPILERALQKLRDSRAEMDRAYDQIGKLIEIERDNQAIPEHDTALERILKAHPPIERVSLTSTRFANIGAGTGVSINYGPIGANFKELLENLRGDLRILQIETDRTIDAFGNVLSAAQKGGFASIVLSGRAPLPERVMHSVDQTMVYVQFHNRACMTAIAADMQVYPKGLEWIPKPR